MRPALSFAASGPQCWFVSRSAEYIVLGKYFSALSCVRVGLAGYCCFAALAGICRNGGEGVEAAGLFFGWVFVIFRTQQRLGQVGALLCMVCLASIPPIASGLCAKSVRVLAAFKKAC